MFQVGKIAERAKELGYQSVAVSDTMTVSSMVKLSGKMKKAGVRLITGCTLRVYDDPSLKSKTAANRNFQIKVFPTTELGMQSLFTLLSKGWSEEYFYYHARVGMAEVFDLKDCLVTTGDLFSIFGHPNHFEIIDSLSDRMQVYVEIVPIDTILFDRLNVLAIETATQLGLPTMLTYPALYADVSHADSLDVLRAIIGNMKVSHPAVPKPTVRDMAMHSPAVLMGKAAALARRIGHLDVITEACTNTGAIALRCAYEFKKLKPSLPIMAPDEFATLCANVQLGWKERFSAKVLGERPEGEILKVYRERLVYELGVLKKMGFSGYFLLVQEIVNWSKSNNIIVGPGRGSAGGSLVAYLLGITDVDPIRFGLMFERFINPDRIDLPDADLDFMSSRRHEVIEYIVNRFGQDRVAGISNYGTLGAAGTIRDVSRMHELPESEYECSKQVLKEHGVPQGLEDSAAAVPDIDKFKAGHPVMWKHATNLEGVMRSLSQHAAGVVVAGVPIVDRGVVENRTGGPVVNWDKDAVEEWGLIKMDILGLSTLDVLAQANEYIAQRHKSRVNYVCLPLNEPDVMKAFGDGHTVGVFQFEGSGMRKLLKDLAIGGTLVFDDLAAATALFRPGPLDAGLVDEYIQVKQGTKKPYYEHPVLERSLTETHGVMAYQEQVMAVARDLAGFTLTEADHLRKAIGKKDKVKMAEMRDQFVHGAMKTVGWGETQAQMLWDKIEGYASYSFNKSHSVEYSVISYWTMWLKVRYPAEFFAASMTVVDDDDRLAALVLDARRMDIAVLPPDINGSSDRIEIRDDHTLLAPFQAIKGISTNVAKHILKGREAGPFTSFADFEARVPKKNVNKSHKEKLEKIGGFHSLTGGLPPTHPDRLRDRLTLMPGFTVDAVKADRGLNDEKLAKIKIARLVDETTRCEGCSLKGKPHPTPVMGSKPKFMMVFDSPGFYEVKKGKLMQGDMADYVRAALKEESLTMQDGYFTTLVKAQKEGKTLTNEQINGCSGFLDQEIDILRPQIIVAMGAASVRFFAPGIKGNTNELLGKVIYDAKREASIIFGFNPAQLVYDLGKVKWLQDIARKIKELTS